MEKSEGVAGLHHRDTESTEGARRLERHSRLCANSVPSVSLW